MYKNHDREQYRMIGMHGRSWKNSKVSKSDQIFDRFCASLSLPPLAYASVVYALRQEELFEEDKSRGHAWSRPSFQCTA